jgi:hypothetical protein
LKAPEVHHANIFVYVTLSMPGAARDALTLYLGQDCRRSLRQLAEECVQHGIKASLPTLKRWSSRFGWQRAAIEHDQRVAEESQAKSIDYRAQILHDRLKLIDFAKSRYEWLIDPDNPEVTPAQRRRATNVTLPDYLRIVKMEFDAVKLLRMLEASRAREPSRPQPVQPDVYEMDYKVKAEVDAYIRKKHGLPPPPREGRKETRRTQRG